MQTGLAISGWALAAEDKMPFSHLNTQPSSQRKQFAAESFEEVGKEKNVFIWF